LAAKNFALEKPKKETLRRRCGPHSGPKRSRK
jgi:hypothetical protein